MMKNNFLSSNVVLDVLNVSPRIQQFDSMSLIWILVVLTFIFSVNVDFIILQISQEERQRVFAMNCDIAMFLCVLHVFVSREN